ncbi:MAG: hypothetical protein ACW99F_13580 [Candidatus Hodarchaeales archaeon]
MGRAGISFWDSRAGGITRLYLPLVLWNPALIPPDSHLGEGIGWGSHLRGFLMGREHGAGIQT